MAVDRDGKPLQRGDWVWVRFYIEDILAPGTVAEGLYLVKPMGAPVRGDAICPTIAPQVVEKAED